MIYRCNSHLSGLKTPLFSSLTFIVLPTTHVEERMRCVSRLSGWNMHFTSGELGGFSSSPLLMLALGLDHHRILHLYSLSNH